MHCLACKSDRLEFLAGKIVSNYTIGPTSHQVSGSPRSGFRPAAEQHNLVGALIRVNIPAACQTLFLALSLLAASSQLPAWHISP